jgi:large subunit ribosomal protein L25
METLTMTVHERTERGRAARRIADAQIPAVLYGHEADSHSLWVDRTTFGRIFAEAGESRIIDLTIGDAKKPVSVVVRDIQRDALSHAITHIDFYQIKRGEEMTAEIPVHITGESSAVKNLGGILMQAVDTIEVKCLPKDLPHDITVDISGLDELEDHITVASLTFPQGVTCLADDSVVVVSVAAPRVEKEETPVVEEATEEGAEAASASTEETKEQSTE